MTRYGMFGNLNGEWNNFIDLLSPQLHQPTDQQYTTRYTSQVDDQKIAETKQNKKTKKKTIQQQIQILFQIKVGVVTYLSLYFALSLPNKRKIHKGSGSYCFGTEILFIEGGVVVVVVWYNGDVVFYF